MMPPFPTLGTLTRTFAKIGLLGFGGPAAQIALMHRIVVDEQRWLGEARFLHALNYCMLLPGPEAQQLATYIGWLMHGVRGGLVAGLMFILPGALVMFVLSALYVAWADLALVQGLFYGVKCAVLAIVLQALLRLAGRALRTTALRVIAAATFCALFFFAVPFPLVVIGAGLAGYLVSLGQPGAMARPPGHAAAPGAPAAGLIDARIDAGALAHIRPQAAQVWTRIAIGLVLWLAPVAVLALLFPHSIFADLARFFATMAVVTFGGAYAVLAYVAQQAVETYGWLSPHQMIDGLGLAETTPGPLILVLQFTGFLAAYGAETGLHPFVAGTLGALLTLWVTFVPSFIFIFAGAPYAEALRARPGLNAALAAVTAAVVGVILNLAVWFGLHVLFRETARLQSWGLDMNVPRLATLDVLALALTAAALLLVLRTKLGVAPLVALFAAAGIALSLAP
jgi:chromate transporter